jgi:hypothetical protein
MFSLARLLGLYLTACYLVLPVACVRLWRMGRRVVATAFLGAPLGVWVLWQVASGIPEAEVRLYLSIGLFPVGLGLAISPLLSLAAAAPWGRPIGPADPPAGNTAARTRSISIRLAAVLTAGGAWLFLKGLAALPGCQPKGATTGLPAMWRSCLMPALGLWPLFIWLGWTGAAALISERRPVFVP